MTLNIKEHGILGKHSKPQVEKAHMTSERPKRISLLDQKRDILTVKGKDDRFEYRWINDQGDRVKQMRLAGWENVTDQMLEIGEQTVDTSSNVGTPVSKVVGPGITAYLMRVLKEYYKEDQARKQEEIDRMEQAMVAEAKKERYGDLKIGRS